MAALRLAFVLASVCVWPGLTAQTTPAQTAPDAAYQAERRRAAQLFQEGKRLEALPLLEQLAREKTPITQFLAAAPGTHDGQAVG